MSIRALIIFIFSIACSSIQAQEGPSIFNGKLINQITGEPVPNANIVLVTKNVGFSSDGDGNFSVLTEINDSLRISAIGFENCLYIIPERIDFDDLQVIDLIPKIYELKDVVIRPYLSYAELRDAIVNYKPSEDEIQYVKIRDHLKEILKYKEPSGEYGIKISGPFSLLYKAFSKYAKSQRKLKKFKLEDKKLAVISNKYSPEIVGQLCGIDEEDKIEEFMNFCNLQDEFLLKVEEIDLYRMLISRYEEFLHRSSFN